MPKGDVLPLLNRLFGKKQVSEKLAGANMSKADFDSATRVEVQLRDTNLDGILKQISDAPKSEEGRLAARWAFAVADVDGKRHVFGPYDTKNRCTQARNHEARKQKWVTVGGCEIWRGN